MLIHFHFTFLSLVIGFEKNDETPQPNYENSTDKTRTEESNMNPLTTVNSNAFVAPGKKLYVNKKQKRKNHPNKSSSTNITRAKRKPLTEIDEALKIGEEIRTQSDAKAIEGVESTDNRKISSV